MELEKLKKIIVEVLNVDKDEITEDGSSQTNTAPPDMIPDENNVPPTWIIDRFNEGNMLS